MLLVFYVCICTHNTIIPRYAYMYMHCIFILLHMDCVYMHTYTYMYTLVLYMYKTNHAYIYSLYIYDSMYYIQSNVLNLLIYATHIHMYVYKMHTIHQLYHAYKYIGLCRWHSPDKNMSANTEVKRH